MINLYGKSHSQLTELRSAARNLSNNRDYKTILEYLVKDRTQELLKVLLLNETNDELNKRQDAINELTHIEYVKELIAVLLTIDEGIDNT